MTFTELVTELQARGFDYLDSTRAGRYINDARQELDNRQLWPYREKSAVGTAPLVVSDLVTIECVTNESQHRVLDPVDFREAQQFGDLSASGSPEFFYVAWPSGTPEVATYPTNTDTIGVQYWKRCPDISGASEPLAPDDYHLLIVDIAAQRAYLDADNAVAAGNLQPFIDRRIAQMERDLLEQQVYGPQEFITVIGSVDG